MKIILLFVLKSNRQEKGFTLLEMLILLVIIAILALLLWPTFEGIINGARVNVAVSQLSQWFKQTRLDGTGEGKDQSTLCMKQEKGAPVQLAKVYNQKHCEIASYSITLPKGVEIDRYNTTFRSQASWAGNGGHIYRVTWEDTKAGDGGSAGQHGKIVLRAGSKLVCIVDGEKTQMALVSTTPVIMISGKVTPVCEEQDDFCLLGVCWAIADLLESGRNNFC